MQQDFLLQVHKPGRYIGREWNAARKNFSQAKIKFALCFPDLYEVGMSNLGLRIIYGILNRMEDLDCERVFAPDIDYENILRTTKLPLVSLENKRKLSEFDILGFSLSYELSITNALNILDLAGIPQDAAARDCSYPLVIAGGPATLNPEPMHAFFDLFCIGEAEEVLLEIIEVYRKFQDSWKSGKISKQEFLLVLCQIPGVYVPSLYEVIYKNDGTILEHRPLNPKAPAKIKKRIVADFENAYFPIDWLIPYIQIVHDRITLEIMRGCPNRCRFCQARSQYFPFRQRSLKKVLDTANVSYKKSGYEEISLCGLSVSDYPQIQSLVSQLVNNFKDKAVGISLPSIKPRTVVGSLSSQIALIRKTGLTFAPEAGTERLRSILAKDFDYAEFFQALEQAYLAGYRHVKLYFMLGLPGESDVDLDAILQFCQDASELRRKVGGAAALVNVSINTLIPKPHTPFQWLAMLDEDEIRRRQEYLKKKARNKKIILNFHNRKVSILEGLLSRGDRRLSPAIKLAHKFGARFDAWQAHFNFEIWQKAFQEAGLNTSAYLKEKGPDEVLPWDFLDIGISKELLRQEFDKTSCFAIR